jgi:hypothetical protein
MQSGARGGVTLASSNFKQHYAKTQAPSHQHVLFGALLELLLIYCRCGVSVCLHTFISVTILVCIYMPAFMHAC